MHTRIPTITVAHTRRNQKQQPDGRGDLTGYPADLFGEHAGLSHRPVMIENRSFPPSKRESSHNAIFKRLPGFPLSALLL
jgi:hypothetical protein